jgi:hypothetical protein
MRSVPIVLIRSDNSDVLRSGLKGGVTGNKQASIFHNASGRASRIGLLQRSRHAWRRMKPDSRRYMRFADEAIPHT